MTEIKLVNHADNVEELVGLFNQTFGIRKSEKAWNWKYLQNPLSSNETEVIIALDKGRIVGARPFMFAEMWINGKKAKTAQHCDTMVHPDHQRMGIFSKMGRFSIEYLQKRGIALSYGFPNSLSSKGFLKQGYEELVETEKLFKIMNPEAISYRIKNRLLARSSSFLYRRFLDRRSWDLSKDSEIFETEKSGKISSELTEIDNLRSREVIDLSRSEDYLRWRFDSHPEHEYRYVLAKRNGELFGFAVISLQKQPDGMNLGLIVDHLVRDSNPACYETLIDRIIAEFRKQENCDIIVTWAIGEPELKKLLLKKFGFKSSLRFPYGRLFPHGHMDVISLNREETNKVYVHDPTNWRVTPAFHDVT
jgi:GNAT superfamily N-acetyltransferase